MEFPDFDTYVQREHDGWGDAGDCTGCLRAAPRITKGDGNRYCEWCVRESYGTDQAEFEFASTLSGLLAPAERWS
jgi:hypothetical protein